MPDLVRIDKHYSKKGLKVIASEQQRASKSAIKKMVKKFRIKFPILQETGPPPNMTHGMRIPWAVVFDSSGKVVFNALLGSPKFKSSINKALKKAKLRSENSPKLTKTDEPIIKERTWYNDKGKSIVAAVLEITETKVKFKLRDGKKVSYLISKLSEEDQNFIRETAEKKD